MKPTKHFVIIRGARQRVRLAQGGWLTVKSGWSPRLSRTTGPTFLKRGGITTYRARTLWQLQRQINGLSTGAHP
jgi:hypothetical protein